MDTHQPSPYEHFVDAVNGLGGPLASIACHAARWDAAGLSDPDAPPLDETMHMLLHGALSELRDTVPAAELDAAARLVRRTTEIVCDEIFLVDPALLSEEPDATAQGVQPLRRWARGGRRRHRR